MIYTVYELAWMFLIYAFLGWCAEVIFHTVTVGDFENRGFLNGPVCPIYGVGASAVIAVLSQVDNTIIMFFVSMVLTSLLELVTGFVLKKIYHTSWWDYSDKPFNIGGYVCLEFSILWGFACVGVMKLLHPLIMDFIHIIPDLLGLILLIFLFAVFIADIVVTILAMNKLIQRMKRMEELAGAIHRVSDEIGEGLHERVTDLEKRHEEFEKSEKAKQLRAKYEELAANRNVLQRRILKAFPKMKSQHYQEHLEKMKENVKRKTK